ncbi:MAG: MarR family transcriptional regulator [Clostridia bacterium]|nr:MarR family transcriptional regulator [Clostridia bacterium]
MSNCKVLYQIKTLEKLVLREIIKENTAFGQDTCIRPTPTQMQIIEYILEHLDEDIYQKDLESVLKLRRATVSGVLITMEKNRLIERVIDSKDTRSKKIILNQKTREIFSRNLAKMKEIEQNMLSGISEEDLRVFLSVIDKMKENVEKNSTI